MKTTLLISVLAWLSSFALTWLLVLGIIPATSLTGAAMAYFVVCGIVAGSLALRG